MAIWPSSSSPLQSGSRKRKRAERNPNLSQKWRTDRERQIYSSTLLSSLRRLRLSSSTPPRTSVVRSSADRVLAAAARGGSRWSRAILSSRGGSRWSRAILSRRVSLRKARKPKPNRPDKPPQPAAGPVEAKVRVLGRLVPGCKKLPLPSLLDETSDYIAALEMQIRAMTVLAGVLSSAVASSTPPS